MGISIKNTKDKVKLVLVGEEHLDQLYELRDEIRKDTEPDKFAGFGDINKYEDIHDWLKNLELYKSWETVPEGSVPMVKYLGIRESDGKAVGIVSIRKSIDHPVLGLWGGHIGYCVRPTERNKGYCTQMLNYAITLCGLFGLKELMVTCNVNNIASARVIEKNKGEYDTTITVYKDLTVKRYWIKV